MHLHLGLHLLSFVSAAIGSLSVAVRAIFGRDDDDQEDDVDDDDTWGECDVCGAGEDEECDDDCDCDSCQD